MCGIAGLVGEGRRDVAGQVVGSMVHALARRGPDGEGLEVWPHAVLGHRRLSILDLSEAGRQPMLSSDRRIGVVFNGCIYNFLELRQELEGLGHSFRSHCDTEVLIHGYQAWGIDRLVEKLRGMFAFAIWDDPRQKLYLVRDRLGVKPLLYAVRGDQIAFASTISALRQAGFAGDIAPQGVQELLELGFITDNTAIYEGVQKLLSASILEWSDGRIVSKRCYWSVPHVEESSAEASMSFEDAVAETERLLIEAVRLRLHADVPIGVLLSSGIDSALVCWAMTQLNARITAYTVSTPGDELDESGPTQETARLLDIPLQVVTLPKDDGAGMLEHLVEAYGEPFGAQSAVAMLRVSAAVKPYATVLLTGDGGDDVFLGYDFYRDLRMAQGVAEYLPRPFVAMWRLLGPLAGILPGLRRPARFLNYCTGGIGEVARASGGLDFYRERGMLGERIAGLEELPHRRLPPSLDSARNLLPDLLDYQQRMWFPAHFMTKVDAGTMYQGLEARAPFLDQKLWEFAARLPVDLRMRGGELKSVLREIVRRRIGPTIATRKKQGFSIPVERWIAQSGHWSQALSEACEDSRLEREGWIQPGAMSQAAEQARRLGVAPTQVWLLLVLEYWMRSKQRTEQPVLAIG